MAAILDQHQQPEAAAEAWLKANPRAVSALAAKASRHSTAVRHSRHCDALAKPTAAASFEHWISSHKIPVGETVAP